MAATSNYSPAFAKMRAFLGKVGRMKFLKPIYKALADACPIVGSYGARDRSLRGTAARLHEILASLGIDHDVKEYPDCGHSFLNDHRDEKTPVLFALMGRMPGGVGYHEPSAQDARARIEAFFDRHLRAGA